MMGVNKYNSEGYLDLTAYEAIKSVNREHRKSQLKPYPRTYICSPFRGDTEQNTQNAIAYCRFALEQGRFPIAPHLFLPRFMDDSDSAERELAISFGLRLLSGCHELWVFGSNISSGMAAEIAVAESRNIDIHYFNEKLEEIYHGN